MIPDPTGMGIDTGGGSLSGSSSSAVGDTTTNTSQSWGGRSFNYKSPNATAATSEGESILSNPWLVGGVIAAFAIVSLMKVIKG